MALPRKVRVPRKILRRSGEGDAAAVFLDQPERAGERPPMQRYPQGRAAAQGYLRGFESGAQMEQGGVPKNYKLYVIFSVAKIYIMNI